MKVSTPSEKIVSTIRNIAKKKDTSTIKIVKDSVLQEDNFYNSKESYNIKATKKDTTLRKTNQSKTEKRTRMKAALHKDPTHVTSAH